MKGFLENQMLLQLLPFVSKNQSMERDIRSVSPLKNVLLFFMHRGGRISHVRSLTNGIHVKTKDK